MQARQALARSKSSPPRVKGGRVSRSHAGCFRWRPRASRSTGWRSCSALRPTTKLISKRRSAAQAFPSISRAGPDALILRGRAFVALLSCGAENLSAKRFAEYLSLGQLPDCAPNGEPPAARDHDDLWVPPDTEETVTTEASSDDRPRRETTVAEAGADAPVRDGELRAPRRWERFLVEAAVIGGSDRWKRRIAGLINQFRLGAGQPGIDEELASRLARDIAHLEALAGFALPLIEDLAALPATALWQEWLERLVKLASRSLRRPDHVLQVLAALAPMADVGPVSLAQVLEISVICCSQLLPLGPDSVTARYSWRLSTLREDSASTRCLCPGSRRRNFPARSSRNLCCWMPSASVWTLHLLPTRGVWTASAWRSLSLSMPRPAGYSSPIPGRSRTSARSQVPSFYALEVFDPSKAYCRTSAH